VGLLVAGGVAQVVVAGRHRVERALAQTLAAVGGRQDGGALRKAITSYY
jgi:hypothetical protein